MTDVDARHAQAARLLQSRMISRLAAMNPADLERLKPAELARLWAEGVRVERAAQAGEELAAGLGFDDGPNSWNLAELTDDELDQLTARLRRERIARRRRKAGRPQHQDRPAKPAGAIVAQNKAQPATK